MRWKGKPLPEWWHRSRGLERKQHSMLAGWNHLNCMHVWAYCTYRYMRNYDAHADNRPGRELLNAAGLRKDTTLEEVYVDWLRCHHVSMLCPLILYEHQEGGDDPRRNANQLAIHEVTWRWPIHAVQGTMTRVGKLLPGRTWLKSDSKTIFISVISQCSKYYKPKF
jgi:hypothetical protein